MKPGSSNAPETTDPFKRNPDGTVPKEASVPPDPSHVESARKQADAPATTHEHGTDQKDEDQ